MKHIHFLLLLAIVSLQSCIGDDFVQDFVEPQIRISQAPTSIAAGESFQIESTFFNSVGQQQSIPLSYSSSNTEVFTVDDTGLVMALNEGMADLTITADFEGETYEEVLSLAVSEETVVANESRSGTIATTSSYALSGSFTIEKTDAGVVINIAADYNASTALPGLYVYLTNNKNTSAGALEIARVTVFEGSHSYEVSGVGLDDFSHILYFCKPFNVKVGDGAIQ